MRYIAGAIGVFLCARPVCARAYRPFDGTDADVAELHEVEIELGPLGYYRAGNTHYFVAGGVLNFGLVPRIELVLQGFDYVPLDAASGANKFTDTGLLVKSVWKEGCLQGKGGPSYATEIGPLLPRSTAPAASARMSAASSRPDLATCSSSTGTRSFRSPDRPTTWTSSEARSWSPRRRRERERSPRGLLVGDPVIVTRPRSAFESVYRSE
jgi:hypothetical protein